MKKILIVLVLVFVGFLVSCGEENTFNGEKVEIKFNAQLFDGKDNKGEDKYKLQEVSELVLKNPKKIAVYDMSVLDTLDYIGLDKLGVEKVALPKGNLNADLVKYNDRKYPNVGTLFDLDEEELVKFDPEVVFIGARSLKNYERIKEIVPNAGIVGIELPQNEFFVTVKKSLDLLKKVFSNNENEFDNILNTIEVKTEEIKSKINLSEKVLFLSVSSRSFSVFGETGRFEVLFDKVNGFGFPPALTNKEINDKAHGEIVTPEYILSVNPDIIFVLDHDMARGNTSTLDETMATLSNQVKAIKNNKVIKVEPFSWYIMPGGARSVLNMFDDVMKLFN